MPYQIITDATADLCRIMLLDSAHIQESDAEWQTRKAQRHVRRYRRGSSLPSKCKAAQGGKEGLQGDG